MFTIWADLIWSDRILKIQWIVDQLWILAQIPDCACLDVRTLGPKQSLDHKSFFNLTSFLERSSFKLRCLTAFEIVFCESDQACCLLYYFREINNDIHIYQFTLWLWFQS